MESEEDKFLEEIKDGSILNRIVRYSDLNLGGNDYKFMKAVINRQKRGIIPGNEDAAHVIGNSSAFIRKKYEGIKRKNKNALYRVTFAQVFNKFGKDEDRKPKLPETLDEATQGVLKRLFSHSFRKTVKQDPLSFHWPRYYLTPVATEYDEAGRGIPVFVKIFDFLPPYKNEGIKQ